jgi:hypothetical protein
MLKEDGIWYTRDREEAIDLNMKEFSYDCTCISSNKTPAKNVIYCYNKQDLLCLTNHWNIVGNSQGGNVVYFYTIPYMEFGKEIEWNGL